MVKKRSKKCNFGTVFGQKVAKLKNYTRYHGLVFFINRIKKKAIHSDHFFEAPPSASKYNLLEREKCDFAKSPKNAPKVRLWEPHTKVL